MGGEPDLDPRGAPRATVNAAAALIEIALVSEQTLANLLPALHAPRPDRVILVASAEMAQRGLHVRQQRLLQSFGIAAEVVTGAPDADMTAIHAFAGDLLARLRREQPSARLVLNATGGNKLMMLGFVEAFRGRARIVYADTQHQRIETVAVGGVAEPPQPMSDVLDVPGYLLAQGFEFESARSDRDDALLALARRKSAALHLGRCALHLRSFIGRLNILAANALDKRGENLVAAAQRFERLASRDWREALSQLNGCGVLKWFGAEGIEFADADSARFCGGGWLEEYAWHSVIDAGPFDARWGAQGHWEGGARNEFDILAVHRNRLLFIECKTTNFGASAERDDQRLYKIESLGRNARGLFGATWFVSAREPTEPMRIRARDYRVRIVGPDELPRLHELVMDWMGVRADAR